MTSTIPKKWLLDLPESIVVGDGCFANALASCLGAGSLSIKDVRSEPVLADERVPTVLDSLKRLFLVISDSMAPADALHAHEALWRWTIRLTSAGDQHDLAFVFILPPSASSTYQESLALGLSLSPDDWASKGYGVWHPSEHLERLLHLLGSIRASDFVLLRARRASDRRRSALTKLKRAVMHGFADEALAAARDVHLAFVGQEYHLDVFCCAPSHANGNQLRRWLRAGVTESVTPEWYREGRLRLAEWLGPDSGDLSA